MVEYLYPKKAEPVEVAQAPVLTFPMYVGIAFVPEGPASHYRDTLLLTETEKLVLMREVGKHFKQYAYVKGIDLLPTQYLTPGGSFENLEQLRTMFGIDVIVLLSYDQVQFTDTGWGRYGYWTLVGAVVLEGEKNETATMVDAAVYHISSRKMLFRAPGTSRVKNSSTVVHAEEELRHDSENGFRMAATNLVVNLQEQLDLFKEKVKSEPEQYQVAFKKGHTAESVGLGKLDSSWLLLSAVIVGILVCPLPHRKR